MKNEAKYVKPITIENLFHSSWVKANLGNGGKVEKEENLTVRYVFCIWFPFSLSKIRITLMFKSVAASII